MKALAPVIALVVGLAVGYGISAGLGGDAESTISQDIKAQLEATRGDLRTAHAERDDVRSRVGRMEEENQLLKRDLERSRTAARGFEERLAKLGEERAELLSRVKAEAKDSEIRAKEVMAKLETMKEGGIQAMFLNKSAMNSIIADLKALGDAGVDGLMEFLKSDDVEARMVAAAVLTELGDPRAVGALEDSALNDSDQTVKHMAARALMMMDGPEALPVLHNLAKNAPDEGVRVNSMFGLCRRGDEAGILTARAYFNDEKSNDGMKKALAGSVVGLLHGNPKMEGLVDDIFTQAAEHKAGGIMEAAVGYYKSVGTDSARRRLEGMVANPALDQKLRDAAKQALSEM